MSRKHKQDGMSDEMKTLKARVIVWGKKHLTGEQYKDFEEAVNELIRASLTHGASSGVSAAVDGICKALKKNQ